MFSRDPKHLPSGHSIFNHVFKDLKPYFLALSRVIRSEDRPGSSVFWNAWISVKGDESSHQIRAVSFVRVGRRGSKRRLVILPSPIHGTRVQRPEIRQLGEDAVQVAAGIGRLGACAVDSETDGVLGVLGVFIDSAVESLELFTVEVD